MRFSTLGLSRDTALTDAGGDYPKLDPCVSHCYYCTTVESGEVWLFFKQLFFGVINSLELHPIYDD